TTPVAHGGADAVSSSLSGERSIMRIVPTLILLLAALPAAAADKPPQPLQLKDLLAWKNLGSVSLSDDGAWLGYRLTPGEGDSEIVVRQTAGEKEYRFPAGESRGGPGTPPGLVLGGSVSFSADSKYAAFTANPPGRGSRSPSANGTPAEKKPTGS